MFDNIGTKLKGLAKIMCWFGIIATVIYGVLVWVIGGSGAFLRGLSVIVIGCVSSYIGSWACYGIGTAAETSNSIYELRVQIQDLTAQIADFQSKADLQTKATEEKPSPAARQIEIEKETNKNVTAGTDVKHIWESDGPLYKKCPQCGKSLATYYLESNKSCMYCGCAYDDEAEKSESLG